MIAAHSDEIGLIVKSVEDSGFIRFEKAGGVQDNCSKAEWLRWGRHIGIVGARQDTFPLRKNALRSRSSLTCT